MIETQPLINENDLRTDAFLTAEPGERGVWVTLKAAAVKRGGNVIAGAAEWDERKTLVILGLRRRDMAKASQLWWTQGADLHVATSEHVCPADPIPTPTVAPEPPVLDGKMAAAGE